MFEIFPCVMNAALDRIIPTRNRYGRLPSLWLTCPSHWLSCKPRGCWWQRKPKNGCTLNRSQHLADEAACKMAAQEYVKVKLNM